jgi:D-alanyl-lipoteichoic acid acyltransferase DltB (MBOAT superfamily)
MLFNSYIFIFLFLPLSFFIYFFLNRKRLTLLAKGWLVLSSLFFYSWWNILYLPLILFSIVFNYGIGTRLTKQVSLETKYLTKKMILIFGIFCNVMLLVYFKYSDFFIENMNMMMGTEISLLHLALPLAISFFTFQQIAYLVDSYRGETREYDFLNYAVFVTFFPQLIAGPIVHHKEMMPQFSYAKAKLIHYRNIAMGIFIFSMGLFKKVVIADTFAVWATSGFDVASSLNFLEAWITSLSYTLQLYFDFSGYTDMAIGVALLFNIKLPINFNSPYKATNIQDFWRRWHMTLSRFLKDYIYIPLGGNRDGDVRMYVYLMITFLIGGIWHGAGWTFVFWGFLHGLALVTHRIWQKLNFRLPALLAWFITFNFINIAWVFFRAKEWDDALKVLSGMLGQNGLALPAVLQGKLGFLESSSITFENFLLKIGGDYLTILWIVLGMGLVLFTANSMEYLKRFRFNYLFLLYTIMLFVIGVLLLNNVSEFLYFNF